MFTEGSDDNLGHNLKLFDELPPLEPLETTEEDDKNHFRFGPVTVIEGYIELKPSDMEDIDTLRQMRESIRINEEKTSGKGRTLQDIMQSAYEQIDLLTPTRDDERNLKFLERKTYRMDEEDVEDFLDSPQLDSMTSRFVHKKHFEDRNDEFHVTEEEDKLIETLVSNVLKDSDYRFVDVEQDITSHIRDKPVKTAHLINETIDIASATAVHIDKSSAFLKDILGELSHLTKAIERKMEANPQPNEPCKPPTTPTRMDESSDDTENQGVATEATANLDQDIPIPGPYGVLKNHMLDARVKIVNDYCAREVGCLLKDSHQWSRADQYSMEINQGIEFWNDPKVYAEILKRSQERLTNVFPMKLMTNCNVKVVLKCINGSYDTGPLDGREGDDRVMVMDLTSMIEKDSEKRPKPLATYYSWDVNHNMPHFTFVFNWVMEYCHPYNSNRNWQSEPDSNFMNKVKEFRFKKNQSITATKDFLYYSYKKMLKEQAELDLKRFSSTENNFKLGTDNWDPTNITIKNGYRNDTEFILDPRPKQFNNEKSSKVAPKAKTYSEAVKPKQQKTEENAMDTTKPQEVKVNTAQPVTYGHSRKSSVDLRKSQNSFKNVRNNINNRFKTESKIETKKKTPNASIKEEIKNQQSRQQQRNQQGQNRNSYNNKTKTDKPLNNQGLKKKNNNQAPPTKKTKAEDKQASQETPQAQEMFKNSYAVLPWKPENTKTEEELRGEGYVKLIGQTGLPHWIKQPAEPSVEFSSNPVRENRPLEPNLADARLREGYLCQRNEQGRLDWYKPPVKHRLGSPVQQPRPETRRQGLRRPRSPSSSSGSRSQRSYSESRSIGRTSRRSPNRLRFRTRSRSRSNEQQGYRYRGETPPDYHRHRRSTPPRQWTSGRLRQRSVRQRRRENHSLNNSYESIEDEWVNQGNDEHLQGRRRRDRDYL